MIQIHGEMSSYQTQPNYCQYHLVIPKIPRKSLSMQDSVCCDYNRTPVIFQMSDNLVFVGVIGNGQLETYARNRECYYNWFFSRLVGESLVYFQRKVA